MAYNIDKKYAILYNPVMNELIQILSRARKRIGLSQAALGQKLGMPQSHISKIEKGEVDLRLSSLIDMARLLGLDLLIVPRELTPVIQSLMMPASSGQEEKSLPEMLLSESSEELE
ncbi:helix-turn-helix domain-containing protein [Vampirovibrio chlorellavorus]|uniref:helix-turn-helix domain-containing protein n=1 Tax=Vampirovibrio chlorellavorus TaxID=758823 RepID=UPI0026F1C920|nr:helix-turn-helix transcriptional regulator [Vampirovibrio chlorellavorus]